MKCIRIFLILLTFSLSVACCNQPAESQEIITVDNGQFIRNGEPYYFAGTNFWYGAILGSQGEGGDRERLHRELDELKSIDVTNLRVRHRLGARGRYDLYRGQRGEDEQ